MCSTAEASRGNTLKYTVLYQRGGSCVYLDYQNVSVCVGNWYLHLFLIRVNRGEVFEHGRTNKQQKTTEADKTVGLLPRGSLEPNEEKRGISTTKAINRIGRLTHMGPR